MFLLDKYTSQDFSITLIDTNYCLSCTYILLSMTTAQIQPSTHPNTSTPPKECKFLTLPPCISMSATTSSYVDVLYGADMHSYPFMRQEIVFKDNVFQSSRHRNMVVVAQELIRGKSNCTIQARPSMSLTKSVFHKNW